MSSPTLVRIKLDFIISYPKHGIPWLANVNDLIVDGLARTIPDATHVMPGARCEMTDMLFRTRTADDRRKAKEAKKAVKQKRKAGR